MLTLITGQPGAGKTLWTIYKVKELAEKENRQVYYSGIPDLKLPWIELENPQDWHKLPKGSIIVLDEAQRLFRTRGVGSQVPEHVQQLETHRHHGFDLFVITQHPMLIDTNVRRLVGRHWHVMRTFGMHRATVHEFPELKSEPDKSRDGSIRTEWAYPKEVFNYYKSAEVHTHKRRIPPRVYALLLLPVIIAGMAYGAYTALVDDKLTAETEQNGEPQAAAMREPHRELRPAPGSDADKRAYVEQHQPRVPDLAYTAPRYDDITRPVVAPKPVACLKSPTKGCKCYSQQATPLIVSPLVCEQIVEAGWFDDTQPPLLQTDKKLSPPSMQPVPPAREGGGVSPA